MRVTSMGLRKRHRATALQSCGSAALLDRNKLPQLVRGSFFVRILDDGRAVAFVPIGHVKYPTAAARSNHRIVGPFFDRPLLLLCTVFVPEMDLNGCVRSIWDIEHF